MTEVFQLIFYNTVLNTPVFNSVVLSNQNRSVLGYPYVAKSTICICRFTVYDGNHNRQIVRITSLRLARTSFPLA